MPLNLTQIATNSASVTGHYAGESAVVIYYPSRITEKTYAQLQQIAAMDESTLAAGFSNLNDILAHLMKEWDVFEDDEQTIMFPLKAERLAELPILFRMAVLQAILGDLRPEMIAPQAQMNGNN